MGFEFWRKCPTNDFFGSGSGKGAGVSLTLFINMLTRESWRELTNNREGKTAWTNF
jgi:hypothetical protein